MDDLLIEMFTRTSKMTWKKNLQNQQGDLNPQRKMAFFYFYNM